jgi:hypothetical protein
LAAISNDEWRIEGEVARVTPAAPDAGGELTVDQLDQLPGAQHDRTAA